MLSDDEWAGIVHEVLHRTGLSPSGQDDEAVRWIAVRHGEDHIHIVAMLARQDGGKPGLSGERYKVRAACLAAEQRYGLRSTAPADRTAARRPSRAESGKAARRGLEEAPRVTLRRQVTTAAASAGSRDEFFARLDAAGVLVRKRFSVTNPGQVTGYAVALPGDTAKDGGPVWYGGGKLATDLTWPKLRQRWTAHRAAPSPGRLTAAERNAVWDHASRAAAGAAAQIRHLAWTNPAAEADAAWATSDTLHVAAAMLGSRILRQAADAYDRAARTPHGRIPPPSLPHCPSPRPIPAASHPHPDSPALIIAARGQHAGHLRPGRAVRPADLGRAFGVLAAWPPRGPLPNTSLAKLPACTARMKTIQLRGVTTSAGPATMRSFGNTPSTPSLTGGRRSRRTGRSAGSSIGAPPTSTSGWTGWSAETGGCARILA